MFSGTNGQDIPNGNITRLDFRFRNIRRGPKLGGCAFANFGNSSGARGGTVPIGFDLYGASGGPPTSLPRLALFANPKPISQLLRAFISLQYWPL